MPKTNSSKAAAVRPKRQPAPKRVLPLPKKIWYKPWTWQTNLPAPPRNPLPPARRIARHTTRQLVSNWKLFGGITVIYTALNLLLVRGFSSASDLTSYKQLLDGAFSGVGGAAQSAANSFAYLLTTAGGGSTPTAGIYQSLLFVIVSLAVIWALRQTNAKHKPRIRDSFYGGMYPLVPFLLIIMFMSIQLLPMLFGGIVYSLAVNYGIAVNFGEKLIFILFFVLLAFWSLYMITASIFALYIVTLPEMTPLKALRTAKGLVYKRRLLVWRKLIFLPIIMLLFAAIIIIPLIAFVTPVAAWAFFALSVISLSFIHGYLYNLYREML